MAVTIEPVTTRSGLRAFVKLPYRLYRGDANWVPPLLVDDYRKLDRARHPFFKHAAAEILLARRDDRPAGRIVAIHDELWEKTYGERAAYWGAQAERIHAVICSRGWNDRKKRVPK